MSKRELFQAWIFLDIEKTTKSQNYYLADWLEVLVRAL